MKSNFAETEEKRLMIKGTWGQLVIGVSWSPPTISNCTESSIDPFGLECYLFIPKCPIKIIA